jgi:hypothetical protein
VSKDITKKARMSKMLKDIEHLGYKTYTFNSHKVMPQGMKGWCDHVVMYPTRGIIIFLEDKFGSDVLNKDQEVFFIVVTQLAGRNSGVLYKQVNDDNYFDIIPWILGMRIK